MSVDVDAVIALDCSGNVVVEVVLVVGPPVAVAADAAAPWVSADKKGLGGGLSMVSRLTFV